MNAQPDAEMKHAHQQQALVPTVFMPVTQQAAPQQVVQRPPQTVPLEMQQISYALKASHDAAVLIQTHHKEMTAFLQRYWLVTAPMPKSFVLPKNANSSSELAKITRRVNSASAALDKALSKLSANLLENLLAYKKAREHFLQVAGETRAFNQLRAHQNQMKEAERALRQAALGGDGRLRYAAYRPRSQVPETLVALLPPRLCLCLGLTLPLRSLPRVLLILEGRLCNLTKDPTHAHPPARYAY